MTVRVGVYGATGYTGLELVRLLAGHPEVTVAFATSEASAGQSLRQSWPQAPDLPLVSAAAAPLEAADVVLLCLPHTRSAPIAAQALARGVRVVDLSADLRLDDPAVYAQWYGVAHPAPDLLPVPYGLPELGRERLRGALDQLIPNHDDVFEEVRGLGLMNAVEFNEPIAKNIVNKALAKGLILNATSDSVLRLVPPLIVTKELVDRAIGIIREVQQ